MQQGQDMTFKHISKNHLQELIKLVPDDINIEIDENTEKEIEDSYINEPNNNQNFKN